MIVNIGLFNKKELNNKTPPTIKKVVVDKIIPALLLSFVLFFFKR
jgi:hypothetical protein